MEEKTVNYAKLGQERVLSIRELIFECVRKWWIIAICAVIFAVLLGGYKYRKDLNHAESVSSNALEEKEEVDIDTLKEALSEEELQEAYNVLHLKETVAELSQYMENSFLMQLNPYNENLATLQYYIDNDYKTDYNGISEKDYSVDIRTAYQIYVTSGGLARDVQEHMLKDVERRYVAELFSIETNSENSFTLRIIARDEAESREITELVQELLNNYQEMVNADVSAHQLKLVTSTYNTLVDNNVINTKNTKQNTIQDCMNKLESQTADLSDAQKSYVEAYMSSKEGTILGEVEEKEEETKVPQVHISKKYVVVGAFGGIVLAVLAIVFLYLMKGTVNSAEDIQYLYNIKILGKLGKAKMFSGMNRDVEKQLQLLLVNMKMTLDMSQAQKVYVAGSSLDKLDQELVARLRQEADDLKLNLEFGENFLYQPESLEKMLSCDAVILLEKERSSKYTDIVNEYRICMEYKKELLGLVMFV